MSYWTKIHGTITVSPIGRTQAEKRYILDTVLEHLPSVEGSEGDMNIYIIQKNGTNSSRSRDEFYESTENLRDIYGCRNHKRGWLRMQDEYILVIDADLRDTYFSSTCKDFIKWLCRLSKRIMVYDIQVKISDYNKELLIDDDEPYSQMFVTPTFNNDDDKEENWCEYLMWETPRNKNGDWICGKPSAKTRIKKQYKDMK